MIPFILIRRDRGINLIKCLTQSFMFIWRSPELGICYSGSNVLVIFLHAAVRPSDIISLCLSLHLLPLNFPYAVILSNALSLIMCLQNDVVSFLLCVLSSTFNNLMNEFVFFFHALTTLNIHIQIMHFVLPRGG